METHAKTLIKSAVTAKVLCFANEMIFWSEDNVDRILSELPTPTHLGDAEVEEALQELEAEGIIRLVGTSDIFLVPDPNLLEREHWPQDHHAHAALLRRVLESRRAQQA